jgi:hypothetical protein
MIYFARVLRLAVVLEACEIPSSAEEGWPRHQQKVPAPYAAGVVLVNFQKVILLVLDQTTPAAKERGHFLMARPPLLVQGGEFAHLQPGQNGQTPLPSSKRRGLGSRAEEASP